MSQLSEQILRYRKMATDDPDYELGHFRLGQALMEDKQFDEAVKSLRRTLEISPEFSKAYQFLGNCLVQQGHKDEAVKTLTKGYQVADERGDNVPREEMEKMLRSLGAAVPEAKKAAAPTVGGTGFRCHRPGCIAGSHAHQLPKPPLSDEIGQRIYQQVCGECWTNWLRNISVKYINENRLDLSREDHQAYYDQLMKEYLGFE